MTLVKMEGEEDWLFRPVERGFLKGESLVDGSVTLEFVRLCNEAIDVIDENVRRIRAALKRG